MREEWSEDEEEREEWSEDEEEGEGRREEG